MHSSILRARLSGGRVAGQRQADHHNDSWWITSSGEPMIINFHEGQIDNHENWSRRERGLRANEVVATDGWIRLSVYPTVVALVLPPEPSPTQLDGVQQVLRTSSRPGTEVYLASTRPDGTRRTSVRDMLGASSWSELMESGVKIAAHVAHFALRGIVPGGGRRVHISREI